MHGALTAVQPGHLLAWHQPGISMWHVSTSMVYYGQCDLNQHLLRAGELFCSELFVNCTVVINARGMSANTPPRG